MNLLRIFSLLVSLTALLLYPGGILSQDKTNLKRDYIQNSRRAAPRDGFPVLHDPEMATKKEADNELQDQQWVIGIEYKGESKAYPITVMGLHELVNDRIGGKPISICW